MNTCKTFLAARVVALGLLSYPVLSQAFDGDHPAWSGHHCMHPGDADERHGWGRLGDRLNLSKDQRQAMNAIEDKYRPEMRDLRQLLSDNRKALATMDAADAKLQESAEAQGKTIADMIVVRKQMRAEVDKVLTVEQRQMLSRMLEQRRRHQHRHDAMGRG